MKPHGYFWCDNCEGNAGGTNCVACGHRATWREADPVARPIPAELLAQSSPPKRKTVVPRVSDERGRQLFSELRQKLNLL